jgi:hypothetical protein
MDILYKWFHIFIQNRACNTNIIIRAGDVVIPDKTSKQTHAFRSVAFDSHGSFEVEIYVFNKREPVYTRNLSSANITWNIGCIELPNFDKENLEESITAVYFYMYIVFISSMHELRWKF